MDCHHHCPVRCSKQKEVEEEQLPSCENISKNTLTKWESNVRDIWKCIQTRSKKQTKDTKQGILRRWESNNKDTIKKYPTSKGTRIKHFNLKPLTAHLVDFKKSCHCGLCFSLVSISSNRNLGISLFLFCMYIICIFVIYSFWTPRGNRYHVRGHPCGGIEGEKELDTMLKDILV